MYKVIQEVKFNILLGQCVLDILDLFVKLFYCWWILYLNIERYYLLFIPLESKGYLALSMRVLLSAVRPENAQAM